MKFHFTIILLLIFIKVVSASGEWAAHGGRSAGMGFSSAAVSDFWSISNNQAGMAFYDKTSAGVYYENHFLINELSTQTGAFTLKTRYGMIGATINYSGDASYNSTKAGLAYAMKFGNRFAAGLQLDYIGTTLGEEYGKRSNVTFDLGIMVRITEQFAFGAHVFNPLHAKISETSNESIPASMNAGFSYTFSDKLLVTAEACKNSDYKMELRSGLEYKFSHFAYARIGVTTNPARYTFGFGLEMKKLTLDLSSSVHQQLGYSPQVSLQYTF